LVDSQEFVAVMKKHFGNYTFLEAFQRTGRIINISVTKAEKAAPLWKLIATPAYPILLNYINSPDIYLWSAVTASCALPGVLEPVELMMKSKRRIIKRSPEGNLEEEDIEEEVPAYPSGVRWMDGSMLADMPMDSLRRQFHVNQFIICQVNPHVSPFVRVDSEAEGAMKYFGFFDRWKHAESTLLESLKHRMMRLASLDILPRFFNGLLLQRYGGSSTTFDTTTIVPRLSILQWLRCLSQPSQAEIEEVFRRGELATWPKLSQITHRLRLEKKLTTCLDTIKNLKLQQAINNAKAN